MYLGKHERRTARRHILGRVIMATIDDARPDMGAVHFYPPDMGAWHFAIYPPAIRPGKLRSRPVVVGLLENTDVVTGKLGARVSTEGKFGADQR